MSYNYCKKPNPLIDQNLQTLLNDFKSFGGNLKIGENLLYEYFFEVYDLSQNLIGFIWFEFRANENIVEINLGKSPSAIQSQNFLKTILFDLDKIKNYLPKEWLNKSKWLFAIKSINPNKTKMENLLISNGFQFDENDDLLKQVND